MIAGPVQIFFLRSSRIEVDLLSYESKPTDKPEQYDWMAEKILDFFLRSSRIGIDLLSYESKSINKREQYKWIAKKIMDGKCIASFIES